MSEYMNVKITFGIHLVMLSVILVNEWCFWWVQWSICTSQVFELTDHRKCLTSVLLSLSFSFLSSLGSLSLFLFLEDKYLSFIHFAWSFKVTTLFWSVLNPESLKQIVTLLPCTKSMSGVNILEYQGVMPVVEGGTLFFSFFFFYWQIGKVYVCLSIYFE